MVPGDVSGVCGGAADEASGRLHFGVVLPVQDGVHRRCGRFWNANLPTNNSAAGAIPAGSKAEGPPPNSNHEATLYNDFMREEMVRLRRERPELRGKEHHTTAFRMAASNWVDAPVNPKNAPAEDGTAAASSGNGNCGPAFA